MPSFLDAHDLVNEGDTAIIYINYGSCYVVNVRRGQTLTMKYGALRHEFLIGKAYGSRVSATAGYVYVLRATPELWTRTMNRRTQILYPADCALITVLLDLHPGSVVVESGTGSGSLTHALARAVAPSGRVLSFDIDEERIRLVQAELETHGLASISHVSHRNVCLDGFSLVDCCDAVFLDLPSPWDAIVHAKTALRRASCTRIVAFSPCIEQVQRTCDALRCNGFVQELTWIVLRVVERMDESIAQLVQCGKQRESRANAGPETMATVIPFPVAQPTHTGYLTAATLLPRCS